MPPHPEPQSLLGASPPKRHLQLIQAINKRLKLQLFQGPESPTDSSKPFSSQVAKVHLHRYIGDDFGHKFGMISRFFPGFQLFS